MARWLIGVWLAAVVAVSASSAEAQDQYICEVEQVIGFLYDDASDSWQATRFSELRRYVISQQDGADAWAISQLGETYPQSKCEGFSYHGFLTGCSNEVGLDFSFNRETLRFMTIFPIGYVISKTVLDRQADNAPFMAIGKCSPF